MSSTLVKLPLDPLGVRNLRIGQWVRLSGLLYTARDAALQRIMDLIQEGKTPPVDLKGQMVYFVGPTPAAPGAVMGAAGPTTSRRMEQYLPALMDLGVAGFMGKGPLSILAVAELKRRGVLYFSAAGGAGAYYGAKIHGASITAYEDLGPEAIYSLHLEDFPAVVAVDLEGGDLFESGPTAYRKENHD